MPSNGNMARNRRAMLLSVAFGLVMLGTKWLAFWLTGSSAILSDAMESVVHMAAVGFAAFSLWLSLRPATARFRYGYERISFVSAGFEGSAIAFAGIVIIVSAVRHWLSGLRLERIDEGAILVFATAVANGLLGLYLLRTGRKTGSLILLANGKHILSDCWTSLGVLAGLGLVLLTGWLPFDPLCAIAVALQIIWSGGRLMHQSLTGLMDYADPQKERSLRERLDRLTQDAGIKYHMLRFRDTGTRLIVEVHLLFPQRMTIGDAHRLATRLEENLAASLDYEVEVITHLESIEDHTLLHPNEERF